MGNYAAPPIFTALLWGLSMLLTIVVVWKADSPWKYAIIVLPVALLALTVLLLARASATTDPAKRQQQV
jgi:membrane protein implicated in regulation of membrane protease activity